MKLNYLAFFRASEEPFKWPLHESTLVDVNKKVTKMMSSNPTSVIRVEMVEKLKNLGIYRENTDCQLETNIRGKFNFSKDKRENL